MDRLARRCHANMTVDRAIFLRQAGHVEQRDGKPFHVRGHAKYRADGNHAGAADARNHHVEAVAAQWSAIRQWQLAKRVVVDEESLGLARFRAMDRDE